jgi:hypothetical protein
MIPMRLVLMTVFLGGALFVHGAPPLASPTIRIVERKPDPHGSPRPARESRYVPVATSLYFEIETSAAETGDAIDPQSVAVSLQPEGGEPVDLLLPGEKFVGPCTGWLKPRQGPQGSNYRVTRLLAVYVEPGQLLKPETRYTVRASARSSSGVVLSDSAGLWSFTTEAAAGVRPVSFSLDLKSQPVDWSGRFFSGLCNVTFCSNAESYGPTYDMMTTTRKEHPRAWSFQRDFWMTGMEHRRGGFNALPNIVRERETRRIAAIEKSGDQLRLTVEDFFSHEQYGIPSGRPVSEDYHTGDEVLIADGIHDARTKVVAVDDKTRTIVVETVADPEGGWKIPYDGPLPKTENPNAPGLFPPGACYLRKFAPHGTACYYWGRLDKEFDLLHRQHGRRLLVNFADAAGDLSIDGRNWTTAKDLAQWHETVREITGHLIDRYGASTLDFDWSIFNEPDLGGHFWRRDWDELQRFYDYTVDGILRAFEDRGLDSDRVFVGGVELAAIFGKNLKLREFLSHCSPRAQAKGALPKNAAFADARLDGHRSRRVEDLCRAHDGKGCPCDFVSIHAYNGSETMAAKLIRAKELALEIDADFYARLWVNSHEACPEWNLPPDQAASDSYLGNGYFASWCMDVAGRQLHQAALDPRYSFGETLLTVWPPSQNLGGANAISRILSVDDNDDGRGDRKLTIPYPEFHVLTLLSDLGNRYWTLPVQTVGGHVISGFVSRDEAGTIRTVLYSHDGEDTQSRSDTVFEATIELTGLDWDGRPNVTEFRFDKDHNSYFREARRLLTAASAEDSLDDPKLDELLKSLESPEPAQQIEALRKAQTLSRGSLRKATPAIVQLSKQTTNDAVREAVQQLFQKAFASGGRANSYSASIAARLEDLSRLRAGAPVSRPQAAHGRLPLKVQILSNGVSFLVITPEHGGGSKKP